MNGGNPEAHELVVMKFGGTSVADAPAIGRLVRLVQNRLNDGVVVVVSALAGITDQLLCLGRSAAEGDLVSAGVLLENIHRQHEDLARSVLPSEHASRVCGDLEGEFATLRAAMAETTAAGRLSPPMQDLILGLGECLSSKLISAVLKHEQISAVHVDARSCIVTNACHTRAEPLAEPTTQRLRAHLVPLLQAGCVPVMGGFIAATLQDVPTTLGRGGSDYTAALVGAALRALRIEIWTDVDGVMSADPEICAEARVIPSMTFEAAAELAQLGAKVLHPSTLSPARQQNIPVYVLNSRNSESSGTQIHSHSDPECGVTAVTAKQGVATVDIELHEKVQPKMLHALYDSFDRHYCPIEMMGASARRLSLVVGSAHALPQIAQNLRAVASVIWVNHQALVSLVGDGLPDQAEVARRALSALADLDARVVSHSGSEQSVSFLLKECDAQEAVQRLHRLFLSEQRQPINVRANVASLCQAGVAWQ